MEKMTRQRLERKIDRAQRQLDKLEARKDHLSNHGHWEIGYLTGKISAWEDWLNELMDAEEEAANDASAIINFMI